MKKGDIIRATFNGIPKGPANIVVKGGIRSGIARPIWSGIEYGLGTIRVEFSKFEALTVVSAPISPDMYASMTSALPPCQLRYNYDKWKHIIDATVGKPSGTVVIKFYCRGKKQPIYCYFDSVVCAPNTYTNEVILNNVRLC